MLPVTTNQIEELKELLRRAAGGETIQLPSEDAKNAEQMKEFLEQYTVLAPASPSRLMCDRRRSRARTLTCRP